jgi:HEAT repeats/HEAT repeat associated with sister chromatid cohesion
LLPGLRYRPGAAQVSPSGRSFRAGRRGGQVVEESCDVTAEQVGLLGGWEVAATGHGRPPADVVQTFGPLAGRRAVVDELVSKDSYRRGHRNRVGQAQFGCQPPVVQISVQRAALKALAARQTPDVLDGLLEHRWTAEDGWMLEELAPVLAGWKLPYVTEVLLRHIAGFDWIVFTTVLTAQNDPRITTALIGRLTDDNPLIRQAAVDALAGQDDPAVNEALAARLRDDDRSVRLAAVYALAGREDPTVTRALVGRLGDYRQAVRTAAVDALAGRDDPAVTQALLACLDDDQERVRAAAVKALAGREGPQVTEALLACLNQVELVVHGVTRARFSGWWRPGSPRSGGAGTGSSSACA